MSTIEVNNLHIEAEKRFTLGYLSWSSVCGQCTEAYCTGTRKAVMCAAYLHIEGSELK